ncbi:MAG: nucleoid-associated protein [Flavobacteriales bacterium]
MKKFTIEGIQKAVAHRVGNKMNEEPLLLSKDSLFLTERLSEILKSYFLKPFDKAAWFNLFHEADLSMNEIYSFTSAIFDNPDSLIENSEHIARHLFECARHPMIKGGELYVVTFSGCILNGEETMAVGLFKSEQKDTFLKVHQQNDHVELEPEIGVNVNKLDKGCIIFNSNKEMGFELAVIDQTNKGDEARYWMDDFLGVMELQDEEFKTRQVIALCKNFITKELPVHFEVNKVDQADMLNRSSKYLKENEQFDFTDFAEEVMAQPDIATRFAAYKQEFEQNRDIALDDKFVISEHVVKQQAKVFKSVIKLDKNFHIYVHGNRNLIEQGVDADGRKYYKLYYDQEV